MRRLFIILLFLFTVTGLIFAQGTSSSEEDKYNGSIHVLAEDYSLQAPDKIPSGWITIDFENGGEESHILFLTRIPEEITYDEYVAGVFPPFDQMWQDLKNENVDQEQAMENLGAELPEWFWSAESMGGIGITPAGNSSEVTLNLKPGTYVMECYMKTEEGEFHGMEGMVRELTVTDTPSEKAPPTADIEITLSNFEMTIDGDISPGTHTVSVYVKEHPEEGFGHNVHVARLEPDTDIDNLVRWMNFMEIDGLRPPNPTDFAGGIQIIPEGGTGYFNIDLEPGRYLFVSEYTGHLGVMKEVTVE